MRRRTIRALLTVAVATSVIPAACGMPPTTFTLPGYNFAYIERVAVIPFENLTEDRGAAARMSRYFVSELLDAEVFDVVEPGEVADAMMVTGALRVGELTPATAVDLGQRFRAQALILGSVTESAIIRSGSTSENVVTLDLRMVETETGVVIWATTVTKTGRGFWSGLWGTSGKTMGEVSRQTAAQAIGQLVD